MQKVFKARKSGFTLIELLIVIMIIAILAGMMMLATGSATDSAEATRIINDMRSIKSAALLYYADNLLWPVSPDQVAPTILVGPALAKHMDRTIGSITGSNNPTEDGEIVVIGDRWYFGLDFTNMSAGVQEKLAKNALKTGIFAKPATGEIEDLDEYTAGDTEVWMALK